MPEIEMSKNCPPTRVIVGTEGHTSKGMSRGQVGGLYVYLLDRVSDRLKLPLLEFTADTKLSRNRIDNSLCEAATGKAVDWPLLCELDRFARAICAEGGRDVFGTGEFSIETYFALGVTARSMGSNPQRGGRDWAALEGTQVTEADNGFGPGW